MRHFYADDSQEIGMGLNAISIGVFGEEGTREAVGTYIANNYVENVSLNLQGYVMGILDLASVDSVIINNNITNMKNLAESVEDGTGIYSLNCDGSLIDSNYIQDLQTGIYVEQSTDMTVTGNTITNLNCGGELCDGIIAGIALRDEEYTSATTGAVVTGNTITDLEGSFNDQDDGIAGIFVNYLSGTGAKVNYNTISDINIGAEAGGGYYAGMLLAAPMSEVINNNVSDSEHIGIFCAGAVDTFSGNTIDNATIGLTNYHSDLPSVTNNFAGNTITNSDYFGMLLIKGTTTDVTGGSFASNAASGGAMYLASLAPLNNGSKDYDGFVAWFGQAGAKIQSGDYMSINGPDYDSGLTGSADVSVFLVYFIDDDLYATIYLSAESGIDSCVAFEGAICTGEGNACNCNFFDADAWSANGVDEDYTWTDPPGTTVVAGNMDPPTLIAMPRSDIAVIAESGIDISSATITAQETGLTIRDSDDVGIDLTTISGGDSDLVLINSNVSATNLTVGPTFQIDANSNLSALDFYLYNSAFGTVKYSAFNPTGGAFDLSDYIAVGSGFVSFDMDGLSSVASSVADAFNGSATVTVPFSYGKAADIYYAAGYHQNLTSIMENGQVCNATSTPTCTNIVKVAGSLQFDVEHFDGYGAQEGENVPEFTDFAFLLAIVVVVAGFVAVRKKQE